MPFFKEMQTSEISQQIDFVRKVISHIEQNGYMEDEALAHAPFIAPADFFSLFDDTRQQRLLSVMRSFRDNAVTRTA